MIQQTKKNLLVRSIYLGFVQENLKGKETYKEKKKLSQETTIKKLVSTVIYLNLGGSQKVRRNKNY